MGRKAGSGGGCVTGGEVGEAGSSVALGSLVGAGLLPSWPLAVGVAVTADGAVEVASRWLGGDPSLHAATTSAAARMALAKARERRLGQEKTESIMRFMSVTLRDCEVRGSRRAAGWLLLVITPVLVLAACGGGAEPTQTSSPQRTNEIVAASIEAMTQVNSFRFTLDNEGGETPIPTGLDLRRASGIMVKPDRLQAELFALFSGLTVRIDVISVDDKTYVTNPISGAWQVFDASLDPLTFFDPAVGVPLILRSLQDPRQGADGFLNGAPIHTIIARVPAEAVQFIAGSFAEESILDIEMLIDEEKFYVREATLDGRITEDEPEGIVRTLRFSDFGVAFDIVPPV